MLVGMFLECSLPAGKVNEGLASLLSLQEEWELFPMNHDFFGFPIHAAVLLG